MTAPIRTDRFTIPCWWCLSETAPDPTGLCDDCASKPVATSAYRGPNDRGVSLPEATVLTFIRGGAA